MALRKNVEGVEPTEAELAAEAAAVTAEDAAVAQAEADQVAANEAAQQVVDDAAAQAEIKAEAVAVKAAKLAKKANKEAKKNSGKCTVTLLVANQITDPGTGILLKKGVETVVPEISNWVRAQAKTQPKYLTFSE